MTRAKSETKATEKTGKLEVREVVPNVTAIVRKQGAIKIEAGQAVYQTENAVCIFDVKADRRIAWIPMARVKDVQIEGKGTVKAEAKTKKPRAKKAA